MAQPPVTDYPAIIDALRRRGSVHHRKDAVPGEFTAWRRRVRQLARMADDLLIPAVFERVLGRVAL